MEVKIKTDIYLSGGAISAQKAISYQINLYKANNVNRKASYRNKVIVNEHALLNKMSLSRFIFADILIYNCLIFKQTEKIFFQKKKLNQ